MRNILKITDKSLACNKIFVYFRGMGLALVLLALSSFTTSAIAQARVTLNFTDAPATEVFQEIKNQTQSSIVYNMSDLDLRKTVSIKAQNEELSSVLDKILSPLGLTYTMNNNNIVITKKVAASNSAPKTITGTVTDSSNEPLIGVSVVVKGTTNGITTDINGSYSLRVTDSDVLGFSYLGYASKEAAVGSNSTINMTLLEDSKVLEDVIVVALGIKREEKTLTYNVQKLEPSALTTVKNASFVNSLNGKIAGLNLNSNSSGTGGSTRAIMRGTKSLFGNNNALYVIDGMPLPELKSTQTTNSFESPDGSDGDGISNINPDDIESITVLTGAAASALYGNMGSNGVILISTKKGESGKTKVSYSNNTSFSSPFVMPRFQNTYGTESGSFDSWGEKLEKPSSYKPIDFFQTGYNTINSVTVSGGTKTNQTFASISALNSRGLIPNNTYNRYNFTVRNSTVLAQKAGKDVLNLDLNFSYVKQEDQNMPRAGIYHNPLVPIYLFPPSDDITKYQLYETYNIERGFRTQNWQYGNIGLSAQNPYWITNRVMFNSDKERFMLGGALRYSITDWINIAGRVHYDRSATHYTRKIYASSDGLFASDYGNYLDAKDDNKYFYGDVIANINYTWNDITLISNLGASIIDNQFNSSGFEGHLMNVANWFHANNVDRNNNGFMNQDIYHDQTQAIFATAQLGYNSVYLDLTIRNDWASTFAGTNTDSFTYGGVGLSAVISDWVKIDPKILSLLKVRASYSEVGSPPSAYITYRQNAKEKEGGSPFPETFGIKPATDLKPERTKAFEVGTNLVLLSNKIRLDVTYYNTNTFNQLFLRELTPTTSGFRGEYINAGKVNNYGLEVAASFKQKLGPVNWQLGLTYASNKNEIKELLDGSEIDIMTHGSYKSKLVVGGAVNDIYANGLTTDRNGSVFVDATQGTISADRETWHKLGTTEPKYTLGISNSFNWKGFNFDFLITARVGGVGTSATQALMDQYGVSQATADARDAGEVIVNQGPVSPSNWYSVVAGGSNGLLAHYTYSRTNVRLKQASISYELPAKLFKDKCVATISLTGQNLFMFYNKAPFDPEMTISTATYFQGYDYFSLPSERNFGFGVNVKF